MLPFHIQNPPWLACVSVCLSAHHLSYNVGHTDIFTVTQSQLAETLVYTGIRRFIPQRPGLTLLPHGERKAGKLDYLSKSHTVQHGPDVKVEVSPPPAPPRVLLLQTVKFR